MTATQGCDTCNKSTLSLVLLRPSPIAKITALKPPGSDAVISDDATMAGLLPARLPTESRFALRMLRSGYVHVYIPTPPAGIKNWLVYRVTEQADLVEQKSEWFAQPDKNVKCPKPSHNAMGMKLLNIPQAHKISEIWIAYSANLWNETLRGKNKANPKVMQRISLKGGSPNTFQPTAANLKSKVLECALTDLRINKSTDHDFPFTSVAGSVDKLAENLTRAAACHPKTKGKEMAVVLRDPVGIATELNALRLRRNDLMEQFLTKPENRQPLEVNKIIHLLKNNVIAKADEDALAQVVPLRTKSAYEKSHYPTGTTWQALTREEKALHASNFEKGNWLGKLIARPALNALSADDVGRVLLPDYEARATAWGEQQAEKDWKKFNEFYDESQRSTWESSFEKTVQTQHLDPLYRFEEDWDGMLHDASLLAYFASHFDERVSQSVIEASRHGCCAGSAYMREVSGAFNPEPKTAAARKTFEAQLDADVTKPDALLLRALFANQADLWETMESSTGKRDKVYDFMKGLIGEFTAQKTNGGKIPLSPSLARKLAWLTEANMGYALGIVGTASAVAMQGVVEYWAKFKASAAAPPKVDPKILSRLRRAEGMALIHRACEEALKGPAKGMKVPVLLTANVSVETLVQIKRGRGEMLSIRQIRNLTRKGQVSIGILTDTETMKALDVAPDKAVHELATKGSGAVLINEQSIQLKGQIVAHAAAEGTMLTLPVSRFLPLYEKQLLEAAAAPAQFRTWIGQIAKAATTGTAVREIRSVTMSMDGRLAIGSMIVQGLGVYNGLMDYMAAADTDKRTDALLSIADGTAGVLGGAAEFGAKWAEVRLGEAAERSAGLAFGRAVAAGMGVAGNIVNAWMCVRAAGRLSEDGHQDLARGMNRGAFLFVLGSVPLTLQFAHALTLFAIRRGIVAGGMVLAEQQLGKIVAARIGTAALGLTVPGVGWALTAVAVGQTIYIVVNTPTPIETWLKSCYFGKPESGGTKRKSWQEEDKAWKALQNDVKDASQKEAA
jgi:hypothetical protein